MSKIKLSDEQIVMLSKLTSLQRKVIIYIMDGYSHRNAYIKAGGSAKTEESIDATVCKMLSNAKVRKVYNTILNSATERATMTKADAIRILETSANVKITDVCEFGEYQIGVDDNEQPIFETSWRMKDSKDIPDEVARCIKSVTITNKGPKIELYDSQGAIKQLSALNGWDAPKKTELTGKNGEALQLKADVSAPEISAAIAGLMEKL